MRSGEEIQADLRKFVTRWRNYAEGERSEAQTFLNELIACYGADRKAAGALFEDAYTATGIMDMYWPSRCIVEMKAPHRADKLSEHRKQALDYWHSSDDAASNRAAPPYVVLCAFQRFEVWEPGRFPSAPRADFTLDELPENYEKLLFLTGTDEEPLFGASYKELTTEAAKVVAELYQVLLERKAAAPETLRSFVMQIVWCLFAEDLGMLEGHPVQRIIEDLIRHPERSSYVELGALFDILNDPDDYGRHGVLQGTRYVNGSLFATACEGASRRGRTGHAREGGAVRLAQGRPDHLRFADGGLPRLRPAVGARRPLHPRSRHHEDRPADDRRAVAAARRRHRDGRRGAPGPRRAVRVPVCSTRRAAAATSSTLRTASCDRSSTSSRNAS